jgi:2-polyprenyl-3-methyl-5-hydroxy-6-metoxy-1,4-benzoquinol methylase
MTDTIELQAGFWDEWNASHRENAQAEVSLRQRQEIVAWIKRHTPGLGLSILDVGCGAGWLTGSLLEFGAVTGTDLSTQCLDRARIRWPQAKFISGDFMALSLPEEQFDVVTSLEVLAHISDQPAFVEKLARRLKLGGHLMLATQNKPVLSRWANIPPTKPGQLRRWVDIAELRQLLAPHFDILEIKTVTADETRRGIMRWVNAPKVLRAQRLLGLHTLVERIKEGAGLGWTILALAQRKSAP